MTADVQARKQHVVQLSIILLDNLGRYNIIEAALLPDERTEFVSTNRLGHGWAYRKLTNQQAIFRAG